MARVLELPTALRNASAAGTQTTRVRRPRLAFLGFLLISALLSLLYLRLTSDLATSTYDLAQLQQEQSTWQARNQELQLQIIQLSSLDRVSQLAATHLQMGPPARTAYVTAPARASILSAATTPASSAPPGTPLK